MDNHEAAAGAMRAGRQDDIDKVPDGPHTTSEAPARTGSAPFGMNEYLGHHCFPFAFWSVRLETSSTSSAYLRSSALALSSAARQAEQRSQSPLPLLFK
jgi:hypothetical protein